MSPLIEILTKIDDGGGTVLVRDGEIRFKIPSGLLDDQGREILAKHRGDLLAMLRSGDGDINTLNTGENVFMSPSPVSPVVDQDLDEWLAENTIEPEECDQCGGLERWEDLAGGWHCALCDPPVRAQRIRERAEKLRRRHADLQR